MSNIWWLVVAVVVIGAGGYYLMMGSGPVMSPTPVLAPTQTATTTPAPAAVMEQTVMLSEQNKSGESGTAVLTEKNGQVVVTLNMTGAKAGVSQPAHIHTGSCPDVGGVVYPLVNLMDGTSVTTLDVTLSELAAQQPLGINVHKSVAESKVYVSCGDLAIPGSAGQSAPAGNTNAKPNTNMNINTNTSPGTSY